jgi:cytochrome c
MRTHGPTNPIPVREEILAEGRAHFADHCASCHGNDGGGNTEMGRGLVHITRHLPSLTADELEPMEELNPKSSVEIREEIKEEEFLKGANE